MGTQLNPEKVWEKVFQTKTEENDKCGATIRKDKHGNTRSPYGWEIDHIIPTSKGGADTYDNAQPLHWKNNDAKRDSSEENWECVKDPNANPP